MMENLSNPFPHDQAPVKAKAIIAETLEEFFWATLRQEDDFAEVKTSLIDAGVSADIIELMQSSVDAMITEFHPSTKEAEDTWIQANITRLAEAIWTTHPELADVFFE